MTSITPSTIFLSCAGVVNNKYPSVYSGALLGTSSLSPFLYTFGFIEGLLNKLLMSVAVFSPLSLCFSVSEEPSCPQIPKCSYVPFFEYKHHTPFSFWIAMAKCPKLRAPYGAKRTMAESPLSSIYLVGLLKQDI